MADEQPKHIPGALYPDERAILDVLGQAWNMFLNVPETHPDDKDEFRRAIHAAQNIVLALPAWRVNGRKE